MSVVMLSPEMALLRILEDLKTKALLHDDYDEILPIGSVPLGTYIGHPDIDIAILVNGRTNGIQRALQRYYSVGQKKEGDLGVWFMSNLYGYSVDFVVMNKSDPRVQTLEHVRYYQQILTDEMRERIYWLKHFFQAINSYGAEVGGITGICVTRLAELYETTEDALYFLMENLMHKQGPMVGDPTLLGRNLFASVTEPKLNNIITGIIDYTEKGFYPRFDLEYFFDHYDKVYQIKRKKSMATDKEYQFVFSAIRKTWKSFKGQVKWWSPSIDYDILVTPWDIYVAFRVTPPILYRDAKIIISKDKLNAKSLAAIMKKYTVKHYSDEIHYFKPPPFENFQREYEKRLVEKLLTKYISVERI